MKKRVIVTFFIILLSIILGIIFMINLPSQQNNSSIKLNPSADISPVKTINIYLTKDGFNPSIATVSADTKIIWINTSEKNATVDSDPYPDNTDHPELNLGEFKKNHKLEFIFSETGTFGFHNQYNQDQKGLIIVK